MTIQNSLQALNTQHQDLKYLAQKAIICFLKSVYRRPNVGKMQIKALNLKALGKSYGLIQIPKISFKSEDQQESTLKASSKDEAMTDPKTDQLSPAQATELSFRSKQIKENIALTQIIPLTGNRKQRKLQRLKRKIALKKGQKALAAMADQYLVKNIDEKLNELRENPLVKRGIEFLEDEDQSQSEEVLRPKKKTAGSGIKRVQKKDLLKMPIVSKRKFQKIKEEGPYAGKNILDIDDSGKLQKQGNRFEALFAGNENKPIPKLNSIQAQITQIGKIGLKCWVWSILGDYGLCNDGNLNVRDSRFEN